MFLRKKKANHAETEQLQKECKEKDEKFNRILDACLEKLKDPDVPEEEKKDLREKVNELEKVMRGDQADSIKTLRTNGDRKSDSDTKFRMA